MNKWMNTCTHTMSPSSLKIRNVNIKTSTIFTPHGLTIIKRNTQSQVLGGYGKDKYL